jgi:hypothetical protein
MCSFASNDLFSFTVSFAITLQITRLSHTIYVIEMSVLTLSTHSSDIIYKVYLKNFIIQGIIQRNIIMNIFMSSCTPIYFFFQLKIKLYFLDRLYVKFPL